MLPSHCPITGVNLVRFVPTVLVGFAALFALDYLIHGIILMPTYNLTPQLWRTPEDMQTHFTAVLGMEFLTALVTALLFTRHFENKGMCEGLRFGLVLGAVMAVMMAMPYVYLPISSTLAISWALVGLVQGIVLGTLFSLTYKN